MVDSRPALPVMAVIAGAFQLSWRERASLGPALALPLGALALLKVGTVLFGAGWPRWFHWPMLLFTSGAFTVVAVTCHRRILLGRSAVPRWGLRQWTRRETRFLGWVALALVLFSVLFVLVTTVVLSAANAVPADHVAGVPAAAPAVLAWLSLLLTLPALYLLARLSLLLPATALDERRGPAWAFAASRGNGWRLAVVVFGLPWALSWARALLLRGLLMRGEFAELGVVLFSLLGVVLVPVEMVALSLAYRLLTARAADSPGSTP